ncbi:MAG TPA: hypothetical protein VGL61_11600 [Kofleriaceae bacterium]|jgi:hypothetical protein
MRAVVLAAIAACGSPSAPAEKPASPAQNTELPAERTTPAPSIDWKNGAFVTTGLPAIARGGEVVVLAYQDHDQARGFPNLRIEVRDRHDATVWKVPVMLPTEYEQLSPDGTLTPALGLRIGHANAELQRLHGVHDFVPMHALELLTPQQGDPHLATGDAIDVDWDTDHVHVFRHNSDREIVTRDGRNWLEPDHQPCPACEVCKNPAFLANVFHAPEIDAVLIELGYKGTDTCWQPSDQLHVIAW